MFQSNCLITHNPGGYQVDFEAALAVIKAGEKGEEIASVIASHIVTQRTEASGIANREAQSLRAKLKKVEPKLKKLSEIAELDLDGEDWEDKAGELASKLKTPSSVKPGDISTNPAFLELKKELEKNRVETKALSEAKIAVETRARAERVKRELSEALAKGKAQPSLVPLLVKELAERAKWNEDGESFVLDVDGESVLPTYGVSKYLEKNPSYIENTQRPGGGSGFNGGQSGGPGNAPDMSKLGAMSMTEYKAARQKMG